MSSTLLVLRQRKRACRAQYGSVEFIDAGGRQTVTNAKMSRDEAGLTDMTVLKMHGFCMSVQRPCKWYVRGSVASAAIWVKVECPSNHCTCKLPSQGCSVRAATCSSSSSEHRTLQRCSSPISTRRCCKRRCGPFRRLADAARAAKRVCDRYTPLFPVSNSHIVTAVKSCEIWTEVTFQVYSCNFTTFISKQPIQWLIELVTRFMMKQL